MPCRLHAGHHARLERVESVPVFAIGKVAHLCNQYVFSSGLPGPAFGPSTAPPTLDNADLPRTQCAISLAFLQNLLRAAFRHLPACRNPRSAIRFAGLPARVQRAGARRLCSRRCGLLFRCTRGSPCQIGASALAPPPCLPTDAPADINHQRLHHRPVIPSMPLRISTRGASMQLVGSQRRREPAGPGRCSVLMHLAGAALSQMHPTQSMPRQCRPPPSPSFFLSSNVPSRPFRH